KVKSPEAQRRLGRLLETFDSAQPSPARLREIRALELLECLGGSEARGLLEALSKGTSTARRTNEAAAILRRMRGGSVEEKGLTHSPMQDSPRAGAKEAKSGSPANQSPKASLPTLDPDNPLDLALLRWHEAMDRLETASCSVSRTDRDNVVKYTVVS